MLLWEGHWEGLSDEEAFEETQMSNGNKSRNDKQNKTLRLGQAWCFEGMAGRPMIRGTVIGNELREAVRSCKGKAWGLSVMENSNIYKQFN